MSSKSNKPSKRQRDSSASESGLNGPDGDHGSIQEDPDAPLDGGYHEEDRISIQTSSKGGSKKKTSSSQPTVYEEYGALQGQSDEEEEHAEVKHQDPDPDSGNTKMTPVQSYELSDTEIKMNEYNFRRAANIHLHDQLTKIMMPLFKRHNLVLPVLSADLQANKPVGFESTKEQREFLSLLTELISLISLDFNPLPAITTLGLGHWACKNLRDTALMGNCKDLFEVVDSFMKPFVSKEVQNSNKKVKFTPSASASGSGSSSISSSSMLSSVPKKSTLSHHHKMATPHKSTSVFS